MLFRDPRLVLISPITFAAPSVVQQLARLPSEAQESFSSFLHDPDRQTACILPAYDEAVTLHGFICSCRVCAKDF